jgi:hypothetical protein
MLLNLIGRRPADAADFILTDRPERIFPTMVALSSAIARTNPSGITV